MKFYYNFNLLSNKTSKYLNIELELKGYVPKK